VIYTPACADNNPNTLEIITRWSQEFKEGPLGQDAYNRASRVYAMLNTIIPIMDDTIVPVDSVLREFIGGLDLSS